MKFYYYEIPEYFNEDDDKDETEYTLKALFVERNGEIRLGTFIMPRNMHADWRWRPNFNGRFTPLPDARKPKSTRERDRMMINPNLNQRCQQDGWFSSAEEISEGKLKKCGIIFDACFFDET